MNLDSLKQKINHNPGLKSFVHKMIFSNARPRWWVKHVLNALVFKHGKGSVIRRQSVINVSPINKFYLGENSTIEEYCVIDNGVGDVIIGNETRVGLRNTVIGPVHIGNHVILAQNIALSGLNHNYEDVSKPIHLQGINTKPIVIEDDAWVGANSVITAGVKIGQHSIIGAGSVVTKSVPPFCIAVGNPARIIKKFNPDSGFWEKIDKP